MSILSWAALIVKDPETGLTDRVATKIKFEEALEKALPEAIEKAQAAVISAHQEAVKNFDANLVEYEQNRGRLDPIFAEEIKSVFDKFGASMGVKGFLPSPTVKEFVIMAMNARGVVTAKNRGDVKKMLDEYVLENQGDSKPALYKVQRGPSGGISLL